MKRTQTVQTVLHVVGILVVIHGFLLLIPLVLVFLYEEYHLLFAFFVPALFSFVIGLALAMVFRPGTPYYLQSILICGMAWIALSLFGCLPFFLGTEKGFLDSYFETVSGVTTTGITLFADIEILPKSILFWRSFIQWLGGLGILTFFLAVTFRSGNTYFRLYAAETHKIEAVRPMPGIHHTVITLWSLYGLFTLGEIVALKLLGVSLFDAVCHSFTTLSTGGFSPYNASIDHFRRAGFAHYKAIEYVIIFFMTLGGINFLLHYKLVIGQFRDVGRNIEIRYFLGIILFSTALVLLDHNRHSSGVIVDGGFEQAFRRTIFTVVSLLTTTGYATTDINEPFFPAMSKQLFLILMLIGGCVGSTGGGIKVLRIIVLFRGFKKQIAKHRLPRKALSEVVIERRIIPDAEFKRITGLFWGWLFLIVIGGFITAFFTDLGGFESISGMFSAVGNIGPCYISVQQMSELPATVKLTYIFGMLAGRLEIVPILLLFSGRAWTWQ